MLKEMVRCILLISTISILSGCDPEVGGGLDDSADIDPAEGKEDTDEDFNWIEISGDTFLMGSENGDADELPVHEVNLPNFEIMQAEVTVTQWDQCVNAGECTAEHFYFYYLDSFCNYPSDDRKDHPMNCVNWFGASKFCAWAGARLPSEAEWEYAARSGGKNQTYPWGDEQEMCEYSVIYDGDSCDNAGTEPVCSKPQGNTSHGLCDMTGNVWEWMGDDYHSDYVDAPSDGSVWITGEESRVIRGGGWNIDDPVLLRIMNRVEVTDPSSMYYFGGFRCAR